MKTITISHAVSAQFLKEVLTTAVEGGISYWAQATGPAERDSDHNVIQIELEPSEGPDEFEKKLVTAHTVAAGIEKVMSAGFSVNPQIPSDILQALGANDTGYIDAMDADVIIQAGLFGEIVYG
ncbi:hypothetical protein [Cupriavidus sp. RAF12]|uniref:hypothetical protein n=1 Tax=Cupriavidus sp. RAF12 TaxID=3233050 RepID=UPI003F930252